MSDSLDAPAPAGGAGSAVRSGQPLRVLHLLRALHAESGGPLTHLEGIVATLDRNRFATRIATLEASTPPPSVPEPAYLGRDRGGLVRLRQAAGLRRWLRAALDDIDIVQIYGVFGWHFLIAAALCRRAGVPYLVRPHGSLSPWFLAQGARKKALYLRSIGLPLLRRAHGVIAMSPMEAESFTALDARIPAVRIYPGVELPEAMAEGGAGDPLRIAFLGRVAPLKNMPELLRAVAEIHRRGHGVQLDVVGDGPGDYPGRMRLLVDELGIESLVHFHGALWGREKQAVLCAAQLLALPSNYENFSHATAEALALGLPVVISDRVALAPLVERYGCGRVVPLGDVSGLADAMLEYADEACRSKASEAARQCARECLSLDVMRASLEQLYLRVAPTRPSPS